MIGREGRFGIVTRRSKHRFLFVLMTVRLVGLSPLLFDAGADAEDSEEPRWYFGFRAADTNPAAKVHDMWGISIGANFNRYLSLELADDFFAKTLDDARGEAVGEFGVGTILSQLRLRYPLFHDRLSPYFIGGAGAALTQFNDRKPNGFHHKIKWDSETFVGTLGAGLDFFIADNVALNVEGRYLFAQPQGYEIDGIDYHNNISSVLATLGVRVFFPELRPHALASASEPSFTRLYFGAEYGGAIMLNRNAYRGIRFEDGPNAKGPLNMLVGARLGADLNRYFGLEASVQAYEAVLNLKDDRGSIGEYAIAPILLQLRGRLPLADGRFSPYALAGLGLAYTEFNDRRPGGENLKVDGIGYGFAAGIGVGLEYFIASNFSLSVESKYILTDGQKIRIEEERPLRGNMHAFFTSLGFRVYFHNSRPKGS